jgi:DNA-binding response OmpR family regulator
MREGERARNHIVRVLIADDDESTRTLIRELIEADGYETITAKCGKTALEAARGERPALAVLEVTLPAVSGYEVCATLRRLYGDSLPIIFISGQRVESFDRVAGLLIGADDYLVKPFAPDELLVRVRGLLRRTDSANARGSLTPRECEVLQLLSDGRTQCETAALLTISPKTVGAHIEHIHAKLGVSSRAQAVAVAFRDKLVKV